MSREPVRISVPVLLKLTWQTPAVCPVIMVMQPPVSTSQMRTVWSSLTLAHCHPLGEKQQSTISRLCPRSTLHAPVAVSHSRHVESMLPESTMLPKQLKDTWPISCVCPVRLCTHVPSLTSQMRTDSSIEPETTNLPSGLKSRVTTSARCPARVHSSSPFSMSHTIARSSMPPVTMRLPSLEPASATISRSCPRSVCSSAPVSTHHTLTVLSYDAVTTLSQMGALNPHSLMCPVWPSSVCSRFPVSVDHSLHVMS
mmetsp:Transcript_50018/g.154543  ORF Transcript_50018/g.154543 Transcript_50018/m.154543 type:complete len:255 (+) Transcript_50018:510-1274(+)